MFASLFFAVAMPMLIVRSKGELSIPEFITLVGIMVGSWTLLVFVRVAISGLLGRDL